MSGSEHWLFQGSQEHGRFGHGTAPAGEADANRLFDPKNAADRVDYAATSLIGHVPGAERARWAASLSDTVRARLKTAVAAWYGASGLSREAFRALLLDPYTSDETVDRLRRAAREIVEGRIYDDLGSAGDDLSAAARQMGPDRWPSFLADAQRRAIAAVTDGQVPGVIRASADGILGDVFLFLGVLGVAEVAISQSREAPRTFPAPDKPTTYQNAPPDEKKPVDAPAPEVAKPTKVVPIPPYKEGETAADILSPGGQLVGQNGSSSDIRQLPGGQENASELFQRLTKGGTVITTKGLPSVRVVLPNGDAFNYRPKSKSGPPTIDVTANGLRIRKLKPPGG